MPQKRTDKRTKDKMGVPIGLICKRCGCGHFLVTKVEWGHSYITRVRDCRHCGNRIRTREIIVNGGKAED